MSIKPTIDGTFSEKDLGITVRTNNYFGYSLSMYAYEADNGNGSSTTPTPTTSLANVTNKSLTINTIGSTITASGSNTIASLFPKNSWGYSKDNGTTYNPIIKSAMPIGGNPTYGQHKDTVTFGVKLDDTIPQGVYSANLTFIATATIKDFPITTKLGSGIASVRLNGKDCASGCNLNYGETYLLEATMSSGYAFTGWSITGAGGAIDATNPATSFVVGEGGATITASAAKPQVTVQPGTGMWGVQLGSNDVCTNTTSGCTYTVDAGSDYTLKASPTTANYQLDTWTNSTISGILTNPTSPTEAKFTVGNVGSNITLTAVGKTVSNKCSGTSYTDNRGTAETYAIATLADGKCWMLENLRLGGSSAISLTSSNTNISGTYTLPASGTGNFTSTTGYNTAAINTNNMNTADSHGWKYGVYYNYAAASAGTVTGTSSSNPVNIDKEATQDICPSGWSMPSQTEYADLWNAYGTLYDGFVNALRTPLSGRFNDSSAYAQGTNGYFWSTTPYPSGINNRHSLYVASSSVDPTSNVSRNRGYSVRCVRR